MRAKEDRYAQESDPIGGCPVSFSRPSGLPQISPQAPRATKLKSISITRCTLVWTANRHNIFSLLAMDTVFALVFTFAYLTGRMEIISVLIACGVCFFLVLLLFLPAFFLQAGAWKMMRSIDEFDVLTRDKNLEYDNGEWCCSNHKPLICISSRSACILYAPFIDFTEKIFYERISSSSPGSKTPFPMRFERIVIPLKGGGKTKQLIPCNRAFCEWFRSRGGHIPVAD